MRSSRIVLCLLALLSIAALPAAASGLAFVVNSGGASISLIDMSSQKEVRRIPVLREPHHLALSPDGKSLLVGDTVGNEMLFLDPATAALQRRMPVADPYQLGVQPERQIPRGERPRAQSGRCLRRRHHAVAEALPDRLDAEPSGLCAGFLARVRQPARHRQPGGDRPEPAGRFCGRRRSARRRPACCGTTARCWWPTWAPTMSRWSIRRTAT